VSVAGMKRVPEEAVVAPLAVAVLAFTALGNVMTGVRSFVANFDDTFLWRRVMHESSQRAVRA